ncbi:uncharacterized protein LOC106662587 [Cimex lectularius]|uniref:Uncharacterized protein n=1 Tax=Cimex lectularius TaxID=79782 RepID=A0A8I6RBT1_CIMLE|nr:uncharacterized protein LOC106662587 [Cimex lectularius]
MVNFSIPSTNLSSGRIPHRREEAQANIEKMETDFFTSFGFDLAEIKSERDTKSHKSASQVRTDAEEVADAEEKEEMPEKAFLTDTSADKLEEQTYRTDESAEKVNRSADRTDASVISLEKDVEWKCICDHTKNARISDLFRKFDAFKEVGDTRMNIWNVRKRQYISKFGPRLKDEIRRTVLPLPAEPVKEREINEDTIWLSDIDRQLLRFIHKPPISRLKTFNMNKIPGKAQHSNTEKDVEEQAVMERFDHVLKSAIKRADLIFTHALKEHLVKLRNLERQKYDTKLSIETENMKKEFENLMDRTLSKFKDELDKQHSLEIQNLKNSMSCELKNAVKQKEEDIKKLYAFDAEMKILDSVEKAQGKMRDFHRRCCQWMRKFQSQMKAEEKYKGHLTNTAYTKKTYDLLIKLKKQHRKNLLSLEMKHQKREKSLLTILVNLMCDLDESNHLNAMLNKEKTVGMELIKEIMREYQKFISYTLKEEPGQGEYLLSYQRMFQLQMDEILQGEDRNSEASSEDDGNLLLSKLKVKMDQKQRPPSQKSSSDDDALLINRPDFTESFVKFKSVQKIVKEAVDKALATPMDSETEIGKLLQTKDKVKDRFECTCPETNDPPPTYEFTEDELDRIPFGVSLVGRYISALDYLLKKRDYKPDQPIDKQKYLLKRQKKKAIEKKLAQQKDAEGELKIVGMAQSSHNLTFEEFKKKRIKCMVEVLRKHPTIVKKILI